MKRCPECRRDYFDDSLRYCLDDGSALLEGPASHDVATEILHPTEVDAEAPTLPQIDAKNEPGKPRVSKGDLVSSPHSKDKRSLAIILVVATIVIGGFFGYRY